MTDLGSIFRINIIEAVLLQEIKINAVIPMELPS